MNVQSYVSSKVEVKKNSLNGLGMFAVEKITKNEVVFIKGGHILTKTQIYSSKVINSYLPLDDNYFLGATNKDEEASIKLYINHSCEPNCGMRGEITFVAMRDIEMGEELTVDYAMIDNEEYEFECTCKSANCRKKVTGFDWKIKELRQKHKGYFARYLEDKTSK